MTDSSSVALIKPEFSQISYSLRSEPVNYPAVKTRFLAAMLHHLQITDRTQIEGISATIGISLNLQSYRNIAGRSFTFNNQTLSYTEVLDVIASQTVKIGDDAKSRITASKQSVTISRVARCFAKETANYLLKHADKNPFVQSLGPNLPPQIRFLNAPYGLNDALLQNNYWGFVEFFHNFDAKIEDAYSKGYVKEVIQGKKKSWEEDFESYFNFRSLVKPAKRAEAADDEE